MNSRPTTGEFTWDRTGPLHVVDSCVAWLCAESLAAGVRSIPRAVFLQPIPYDGMPCSPLMQGKRGLVLPQFDGIDSVDSPVGNLMLSE